MIVIAGLTLGVLFGYWRASKRGGNRFDKTQYMLVHAILFGVIGIFATILMDRKERGSGGTGDVSALLRCAETARRACFAARISGIP